MAMTQRSLQRADTRRRVLAAAAKLFSQHGFEGTATSDIAKQAGVSQGTIFQVAPNKEALLVLAFVGEVADTVAALRASSPKGARLERTLAHHFGGLLRHFGRNPALSRIIVRSLIFIPDEGIRAEHEASRLGYLQLIEGLVADAQKRGEIRRKVSPRAVAENAFALYLFVLVEMLENEGHASAQQERALESRLTLLLNGVRA
jgi:AcrR family transcriptional regulator